MTARYSKKLKARLSSAPKTLGKQLLLWAIDKEFSIEQIAACLGMTKQTVYNWSKGGDIRRQYRANAEKLIRILHDADDGEEAWKQACKEFNLER